MFNVSRGPMSKSSASSYILTTSCFIIIIIIIFLCIIIIIIIVIPPFVSEATADPAIIPILYTWSKQQKIPIFGCIINVNIGLNWNVYIMIWETQSAQAVSCAGSIISIPRLLKEGGFQYATRWHRSSF